MQALRLHEVLARVVAWHNRHPLARRINATQVHSIGEVLLPFASAQALPSGEPAAQAGTDIPPALPAWRPRAAPASAPGLAPAPAGDPGETVQPAAAPESSPAIDPPPEPPVVNPGDEDDGVELEIDIDLHATDSAAVAPDSSAADEDTAAAADAAPFDPDAADPAPAQGVDRPDGQDDAAPATPTVETSATDLVDDRAYGPMAATEAGPAQAPDHDADPAPRPSSGLHRAEATAGPAPAPRPTGLRRLLLALRTAITGRQPGMPRLRAAFSRDFIWPLTPKQVARWAQRHGQAQPLAPADWPRRRVDTDGQRLSQARQKGLAHTVQLHVLTAAIGVGDRRIRVLMDAQGAVIGPRAYSRARIGAATSLLMAGVLGVGWGLWWPTPAADADAPALAALAASAPASATASAPALGDAVSAPTAVAASAVVEVPVAAVVLAPAASANLAAPAWPASATQTPLPAQAAVSAGQDAAATPAQAQAEPGSDSAPPVASIRPALSPEVRQQARLQGEQLRASPPAVASAPAPAPVYAVVSRPTTERSSAARSLALMRASSMRLPPPLPDHGELMRSQGEWRAAWWPFASLADAERARVLLAGRGLKADVVEF